MISKAAKVLILLVAFYTEAAAVLCDKDGHCSEVAEDDDPSLLQVHKSMMMTKEDGMGTSEEVNTGHVAAFVNTTSSVNYGPVGPPRACPDFEGMYEEAGNCVPRNGDESEQQHHYGSLTLRDCANKCLEIFRTPGLGHDCWAFDYVANPGRDNHCRLRWNAVQYGRNNGYEGQIPVPGDNGQCSWDTLQQDKATGASRCFIRRSPR